MYRILFSDIDGTLLNNERKITPETKKEIERIKTEKNIPVILISSRMPKAMKHICEELGLNNPIVPYNGALILNSADMTDESSVMFSSTIPPGIVETIIRYKKDFDFHISLYYNDDWYVEGMDFWADREVTSTKVTPSVSQHEIVLRNWENKKAGAHKVMCMGNAADIEKLFDRLNAAFPESLNLYRSKPTFLEITPKTVSKSTALTYLLNYLRIEPSEAVAVGDNYNDIEMLEAAGLGIAMGNAPDSVKRAADFITLSNKENGLAAAVKKFF